MEVDITSVFKHLGILPFQAHSTWHSQLLASEWNSLIGSGKWAIRGHKQWVMFLGWVSENLMDNFPVSFFWMEITAKSADTLSHEGQLPWHIFYITSDLLVKNKWLYYVKPWEFGIVTQRQRIAYSILSNIHKRMEHKNMERESHPCMDDWFFNKK